MYTSHIGVNWNHFSSPFYKGLQDDQKRIHSLFARAKESGVRVIPSPLDMDDIKRFVVSNRYAIIVLANLGQLRCNLCNVKIGWRNWFQTFLFPENETNEELEPLIHNLDEYSNENLEQPIPNISMAMSVSLNSPSKAMPTLCLNPRKVCH
jgi:hypothetical protein